MKTVVSPWGNEEYLDVLGGWDWLVNEKGIPPERIGMVGNSLGAATTLIAFSQEPALATVFVDSPFDNLPRIIDDELERNSYPKFLTPGGILMARLVAGDNVVEHDPHEAIERGQRPSSLHRPRHSRQPDFCSAQLRIAIPGRNSPRQRHILVP